MRIKTGEDKVKTRRVLGLITGQEGKTIRMITRRKERR